MVSGETVLKFTDYPVAYAFLAILFNSANYSISEHQILFLGLAGALGTFLTIIDPMGIAVRKRAKGIVLEINKKDPINTELPLAEYRLSSLKTRAINFEFEKIIGLFYFLFMIFVFLFAVALTDFVNDIMIYDSEGNAIFSKADLRLIVFFASTFAFGALAFRAFYYWTDLEEKIEIAGFHQIAINNDNATQTSVDSMTRAVEQNDWGLAKIWQEKIKEEIKYKKGKRELIIKAADSVFSPLHIEGSEFQKHLQTIRRTRQFTDYEPKQWNNIKQNSLQSIIEDQTLRHRIEEFFKMLNDYNTQTRTIFGEMSKIIQKNFAEKYGNNVDSVEFYSDSSNSGNSVNLQNCAMSEIHPIDFDSRPRPFGKFRIRFRNGSSINYQDNLNQQDFNDIWELVLKDVKNNNSIIKIKKFLKDLEVENERLMKIYSEKIKMQWNV